MAQPPVEVEGLAALERSMREAPRDTRKAITGELRVVAQFVRDIAVYEAHAKGLDDTGDLIRGLKGGASGLTGYVRDTARHRGYNYPGRLEFENGGRLAFIRPAVEKGRPAIEARLEQAVGRVIDNI